MNRSTLGKLSNSKMKILVTIENWQVNPAQRRAQGAMEPEDYIIHVTFAEEVDLFVPKPNPFVIGAWEVHQLNCDHHANFLVTE